MRAEIAVVALVVWSTGCFFDRSGLPTSIDANVPIEQRIGDGPRADRPDLGPDTMESDSVIDVAPMDGPSLDGPQPDGPQPDGPKPDMPADIPLPDLPLSPDTIDPLAPFGTPTPLAALNTSGGEDDPTLTGDMLEIYFDRDGDIYRSTRTSVAAGWGAPQAVTALNTADGETTPGITPDGLTIFISSDRSGALGYNDIWISTRASRTAQWSTPQHVSDISTSDSESSPCPSPDLLTLTFAVRINSDWDIVQSTRASTSAAWPAPAPVANLNTSSLDGDPWLVGDVVMFGSERPTGLGSYDLYVATASGGVFGAPLAVASLNTSSGEGDPWISADLRTLFFASDRNGSWDLFVATR